MNTTNTPKHNIAVTPKATYELYEISLQTLDDMERGLIKEDQFIKDACKLVIAQWEHDLV